VASVFHIMFLPALIFVSAMLQVRWTTPLQTSLTIEAFDREDQVVECLESTLQARIRFEVRVCRRRSGWLDHCEDARTELHTAEFDEVTESYRVVSDRLGDEAEAIAVGLPTRTEAVKAIRTLDNFPLAFLIRDEREILSNSKAYLQIRTIFTCRGGNNRTLAHLSRILTLGLLNTVEDRSDWSDFSLSQP
jgi:hypothetical protein